MDYNIKDLSRKYAKAIFSLALEQEILTKVEQDLKQIAEILKASSELEKTFSSNIFKKNTLEIINQIVDKYGFSKLILNFFNVLRTNNRLPLLIKIAEEFNYLVMQHRGIVIVEITTERKISSEQLNELSNHFAHKLKVDHVEIVERIDKAILGGMLVRIGSSMIDATIATKLNKAKIHLADQLFNVIKTQEL